MMVMCTYASPEEVTRTTHCPDLDQLLAEVRQKTGRLWGVIERRAPDRKHGFLWLKRSPRFRYMLLASVGGCEFQVINFWRGTDWTINPDNGAELAVAYLYGLLAATPTAARKEDGRGEAVSA